MKKIELKSNYLTPEESIIQKELFKFLYSKLKELDDNERKVIRLFFFEGKNTLEIARDMCITRKAVTDYKENALNRIKTELQTYMHN